MCKTEEGFWGFTLGDNEKRIFCGHQRKKGG